MPDWTSDLKGSEIAVNGEVISPRRKTVEFLGDGVSGVDDPATGRTKVTIVSTGGGGGPSTPSVTKVDLVITSPGNAHSGVAAIDDVTPTANVTTVLDVAHATAALRGPWVAQSGAWTRPTNYDADADVALLLGTNIFVQQGSAGAGRTWQQTAGTTLAGSKTFKELIGANLGNTDLTGIRTESAYQEVADGSGGSVKSIDWTTGYHHALTLSASTCTLSFVAPLGVSTGVLKLIQDATGGRSVVWPAEVVWADGVTPKLSIAANAVDTIRWYYNGANYYATLVSNTAQVLKTSIGTALSLLSGTPPISNRTLGATSSSAIAWLDRVIGRCGSAIPTFGYWKAAEEWLWTQDDSRRAIRARRAGVLGDVARANSTAYTQGASIITSSGRAFVCVGSGTSAGSAPGGYATAAIGDVFADGSAYFECVATTVQTPDFESVPRLSGPAVTLASGGSTITLAQGSVRELGSLGANSNYPVSTTGAIQGDVLTVFQRFVVAFTATLDCSGSGGDQYVLPVNRLGMFQLMFNGTTWVFYNAIGTLQ